jgi:hypothetical protein
VPGGFEELQNSVTNVAKSLEKVLADVAADFAATESRAAPGKERPVGAARTNIARPERGQQEDARATLEKRRSWPRTRRWRSQTTLRVRRGRPCAAPAR